MGRRPERLSFACAIVFLAPLLLGQSKPPKSDQDGSTKPKTQTAKTSKKATKNARSKSFSRDDHTWTLLYNSGVKAHQQGQYAKARDVMTKAKTEAQKFGPGDDRMGMTLFVLAESERMLGRFVIAEPIYKEAIAIQDDEHKIEEDPSHLAHSLIGLGTTLCSRGKYAEAEPLLSRAVDLQEHAFGDQDPKIVDALIGLGEDLLLQAKLDRAEPLFRRALEIREEEKGEDAFEVAAPLLGVARTLSAKGEHSECEPMFRRALELSERRGREHPQVAVALFGLGEALRLQGKPSESIPIYKRGVAIAEKNINTSHIFVGYCLAGVAAAETDVGRLEAAERDFTRSLEILEKILGPDHPDVKSVRSNQSICMRRLGKRESDFASPRNPKKSKETKVQTKPDVPDEE